MWVGKKNWVCGAVLFASAPAIAQDRPAIAPPSMRAMMPLPSCARGCLSPVEAIAYAAYLAPRAAVAAEFEMTVKAVGTDNGRIFLNSETDYRDRNCLSIALTPSAALMNLGASEVTALRQKLVGRRIVVRGVAQRVRIEFLADGKPSGKYYYQVQVPVSNNRQIALMP
jgi:hypothetical protein